VRHRRQADQLMSLCVLMRTTVSGVCSTKVSTLPFHIDNMIAMYRRTTLTGSMACTRDCRRSWPHTSPPFVSYEIVLAAAPPPPSEHRSAKTIL
jgi:hypothetical protein